MRQNLYIRTKDRRVIRLEPNAMQEAILASPGRRRIILKYRQGGASTITLARYFVDTITQPNTNTMIVAHDLDSAIYLFGIVRLFYDRLPKAEKERINGPGVEKPTIGNRREMHFAAVNSWITVGTAGSQTVGRGRTINNLALSEFAFWPDPVTALSGLLETLAPDGDVTIETTPNGAAGYFYELWNAAREGATPWTPLFYPWHTFGEYATPLDLGERLELTDEERTLGLRPEQAKWRRQQRSAPETARIFAQEYPEDDGTCFLQSGRPVFDAIKVRDLMHACPPPLYVEDALAVWADPEPGVQYVIGADTAEGLEGGDYDAAYVIRKDTGEDIAELHGQWEPHLYGQRLAALGRRYNNALIAPERNNHGHSVLNTLMHQEHYGHLYHHEDYDEVNHTDRLRPGWPTDQKTKPVMIDALAQAIGEGTSGIKSAALCKELLAYVFDAKGRMGAQSGAHDDRVMARSIALQVRLRRVGRSAVIGARQANRVAADVVDPERGAVAVVGGVPLEVKPGQPWLPVPAAPKVKAKKAPHCPTCDATLTVHNAVGQWLCRTDGWIGPDLLRQRT